MQGAMLHRKVSASVCRNPGLLIVCLCLCLSGCRNLEYCRFSVLPIATDFEGAASTRVVWYRY